MEKTNDPSPTAQVWKFLQVCQTCDFEGNATEAKAHREETGHKTRQAPSRKGAWFKVPIKRTVLLLALTLYGCTGHIDFSEPYHLKAVNRIPVAVDPALQSKVETSSFIGDEGTYELGSALAYVIDNRPDAPSKIEYVSSNLDITQGVNLFEGGMMVADYTLLVKHKAGESSSLVEARGKGVSHLRSFRAAQEAIEKAVIDLATKVRALTS